MPGRVYAVSRGLVVYWGAEDHLSLRLDRTYTLGVVAENVAEFFSALILRGILDYFAGSSYSVIILNTYYNQDTEKEAEPLMTEDEDFSNPIFDEWHTDNEWYGKNEELSDYADEQGAA